MNLGAIMKLAKSGFDGKEIGELMRAFGVEVEMLPVSLEEAPAALRSTAVAAGRRGASLHRLAGRTKAGDRVEALIVMVPAEAPLQENLRAPAKRAIVAIVN